MPILIFPDISHKEAYIDIISEWKQSDEFKNGHISPWALFRGNSFEEFLQIAQDDLWEKNQWVPATLFFLMELERILGAIQIRHSIDLPHLMEFGGHISYGIRPSERRKWYAREMLRLGLIETKKLWIERVLLWCSDDNPGSYKTIEANGGVFDRYTEFQWEKARRYWIEM